MLHPSADKKGSTSLEKTQAQTTETTQTASVQPQGRQTAHNTIKTAQTIQPVQQEIQNQQIKPAADSPLPPLTD
jgi:hypothetical protein